MNEKDLLDTCTFYVMNNIEYVEVKIGGVILGSHVGGRIAQW